MAGEKGKARPVCGKNKNFLEIHKKPLFFYVIRALEKSQYIHKIYIIGNSFSIKKALAKYRQELIPKERLIILEQKNSFLENAWFAYEQILEDEGKNHNLTEKEKREFPVFYLSGDIPLITPHEIDEFLENCNIKKFDYFLGVSPEASLKPFYPRKDRPGIKLSYYYTKENKYRQNNMHLIKPGMIINRHYIQTIYDLRYQQNYYNIIRLLLEFIKVNVGIKGLYIFGLLHWNQFLARIGLKFLTLIFRYFIPLNSVLVSISRILGTRFTVIETRTGGAALDVD
ncbi:MAG: NTP transferase domain-containing protein, partial [Thermodesulfobacteriota bacterium]|nr:NTP transferase domain-containing protein [Thermodesulfobacteriota bacterium]